MIQFAPSFYAEEGDPRGPILSRRGYSDVMFKNAAMPIYLIFGQKKLPSTAPQAGTLEFLSSYLSDFSLPGGLTDYYYIAQPSDVANSVDWRTWQSWIPSSKTTSMVRKELSEAGWRFDERASNWIWEFTTQKTPVGQFVDTCSLVPKPGGSDTPTTLAQAAAFERADLEATLRILGITQPVYVTPAMAKKWNIPVTTSTEGRNLPSKPTPGQASPVPQNRPTTGPLPPANLSPSTTKPIPASTTGDVEDDPTAEIGTVAFTRGRQTDKTSNMTIARTWMAYAARIRPPFYVFFSRLRNKDNNPEDVRTSILTAASKSQFRDYIAKYDVLFPALMANESAWNKNAINPDSSAAGLLQWLPSTAELLRRKYGLPNYLTTKGRPNSPAIQGTYLGAYIFDLFNTAVPEVYDVNAGKWKAKGEQLRRLMATECPDIDNPYLVTCWLITFFTGAGTRPWITSAPRGEKLNAYWRQFITTRKAVMAAVIGQTWAGANITNFEKFA